MYLFSRKGCLDPTAPITSDAEAPSWIYTIGETGGLLRRAGGGSTGGGGGGGRGGGGGSSGSGGSRGGGGSSGSSGSRGSTGGSGIGSTALRGGSTLGGSTSGQRITTSGFRGTTTSGKIWSSTSPYGRSSRPSGPYFLTFGYWPIYWGYDYPEGGTPTNNTRPGGPLISAAFTPMSNTTTVGNTTYIVYGDTQSVQELIPKIIEECDAVNRTSGFNASANSTMQMYREESFALLGVGLEGQMRNSSFESCVNNTIGYNLPVLDSGAEMAIRPVGGLGLILAVIAIAGKVL